MRCSGGDSRAGGRDERFLNGRAQGRGRPHRVEWRSTAISAGFHSSPLCRALARSTLKDVSVAGFDGSEAYAWMRPRLSCVHQDIVQNDREAVVRLRSLIEETEGEWQRPVSLRVSLSVRESTGLASGREFETSADGPMAS